MNRAIPSMRLNEPFKPSRDFWGACIVFGGPALWLWLPTQAGLPWYSYAASCIFIPVAAAIVCYGPILVVRAVISGDSTERRVAAALVGALAAAGLFLFVAWWVFGFSEVPHLAGAAAVVLAQMTFAVLATRKPNKARDQTAHSFTPPRAQQPPR